MQRRMKKRTKPKPLPPIDAEGILQVLANVRELIPHLNKEEALPPRKSVGSDERMASAFISADAVEEFGYQAVIEGLESVAQEISEALEQKHAKLVEDSPRPQAHAGAGAEEGRAGRVGSPSGRAARRQRTWS